MSEELRSCPFCGHRPYSIDYDEGSAKGFSIECHNRDCPADGVEVHADAKADAIAAWNRRAPDAQIEALKAALRGMFCPRPCNDRPDDFDVGPCVDAGECGCLAGAALRSAEASKP